MGLKANTTRDVFPGYITKVFQPIPASWFDPKAWGIAETWAFPDGTLTHAAARFQTANVQVGDNLYVLSDEPIDALVALVFSETTLATNRVPTETLNNVLYKVGHDHVHTIKSLAQIVSQRNVTFYTVHYDKLYTGASLANWNTDQTGEVYVISHDIQKAVWLDGDIGLKVGFPDEPKKPPEILTINDWPSRFPQSPRPDYPSGLEPAGLLRQLLTAEHGSLKDAYGFYY